jgi:hypothetical protein
MGVVGPDRKRAGCTCFRIHPVPIGGLDFLRFHHKIPAPDEVWALIIEADPMESPTPCGERWCCPFFHFDVAMGAFWYVFMLVHGRLLLNCTAILVKKEPNLKAFSCRFGS